MFIKSIKLNNFQCYYGENTIEFSEGLNLILGANGFGKSKLYDAFQWVFHDYIYDADARKFQFTSSVQSKLICDKAKEETLSNDIVECFVELEVTEGDKLYRLKRSYQAKKISQSEFTSNDKSETKATYQDENTFIECKGTFESITLKMIPNDTRPYIWFQGERGIDDLIKTTDAKSLREVIKNFSNVSTWDRFEEVSKKASEVAEKKHKECIKKYGAQNIALNNLEIKIDNLKAQIQRLENIIKVDKETLSSAQQEHEGYISQLSVASEIKLLNKDLEYAQSTKDTSKKKHEEPEKKYIVQLFEQKWLLSGLKDYVKTFGEKWVEYELEKSALRDLAAGNKRPFNLPPNVPDPGYLEKMLEDCVCYLCNREIEAGTDAYHSIEAKLQNNKPAEDFLSKLNNHGVYFDELRKNALKLEDVIQNIPNSILQYQTKLEEAKQEYKCDELKVNNLLDEIKRKVQDAGIENAQAQIITSGFEKSTKDQEKANRSIGENEGKLKKAKELLGGHECEIKKLTKGNKDIELANAIREMAKDIFDIVFETKERVYKELVKKLETQANEHFKRINKIAGAFVGDIVFKGENDGYKPRIMNGSVDVTSTTNTSNISAMKLSIILAIISVKEDSRNTELYPLIADAPVSDFDMAKTKALLCEVGNTFNQSIIIFKEFLSEQYTVDKEALEDLRAKLPENKRIRVYRLVTTNEDKNQANDRTKIYTKIEKNTDL